MLSGTRPWAKVCKLWENGKLKHREAGEQVYLFLLLTVDATSLTEVPVLTSLNDGLEPGIVN